MRLAGAAVDASAEGQGGGLAGKASLCAASLVLLVLCRLYPIAQCAIWLANRLPTLVSGSQQFCPQNRETLIRESPLDLRIKESKGVLRIKYKVTRATQIWTVQDQMSQKNDMGQLRYSNLAVQNFGVQKHIDAS